VPSPPVAEGGLESVLVELLALERELIELDYVRRSDALERVREAVRRLGEVGSPQGILDRAADELGASSQFDRILISALNGDELEPRGLWTAVPGDTGVTLERLRRTPIRLDYPLIEHEVASRRSAELVEVARAGPRACAPLAEQLGWRSYVVAALTVRGNTVGLLHADATASARQLGALDREIAVQFADGLAGVFERAALRETLQRHHDELQSAVRWMSARVGQLASEAGEPSPTMGAGVDPGLLDALTPREREVLQLLARGQTNLAIANALVVREGTVKYHVKNILRKLGATSRADAVSRYVRAGGRN
jgi:DNA-binding CsgD family transcriptional regulator/GAF domain-containing protein